MASSVTLAALARAAKLPPSAVIKTLFTDHGVTTALELKALLANADAAKSLPREWRLKLSDAVAKLVKTDVPSLQWRPNGESSKSRIVVMQGDLTAVATDAIVNPANSMLSHGGGLAGAIVRRGGSSIQAESRAWISEHATLPVGEAMSTSAGTLPCRYVIHTVGPRIGGGGTKAPTPEQAQELRNAVWNSLLQAEKLELKTIAIPGISSGIFGYPRDLAAREILGECVRFCREDKAKTLETIVLMNNDAPTCECFIMALEKEAGDAVKGFEEDLFAQAPAKEEEEVTEPRQKISNQDLINAMRRVHLHETTDASSTDTTH